MIQSLREMVMATERWMRVPVAEDRKVKVIYEKTARRVVAEARLSEDFSANIGLTQGVPLVLYYLLFSETDKQEDQP